MEKNIPNFSQMIHLLAVGYQHWYSICSSAFVSVADPPCFLLLVYIHAASAAGIQVSLVLHPCSFVRTTLTFYFLWSSLKSNYLHQLDFLIPSSIVSIRSFQHHQEMIFLPLGNRLKYLSEIMQEVIAIIFIFSCDNIPVSQIPNCWTISKHLEKCFIIVSFLVPYITFILLYLPREKIALNNPCVALRKGGKPRYNQILDQCTDSLMRESWHLWV